MRNILTMLILVVVCWLPGSLNAQLRSQAVMAKQPEPPRAPAIQAPFVQHDIDGPREETRGRPGDQKISNRPHDWVDWLNAFSTLIIAAFTAGMVIVIAIQIREYRTRERAWVTFVPPELQEMRDKDGRLNGYRVFGFIKNFGSTPATISRKFHFKSSEAKGKGLSSIPPYLEINESQTEYLLVPGAIEPAIVDIHLFEVLNIEKLDIHVLGQIVYKDVFGRSHETRYCLRFTTHATVDKLPGFYPDGPPEYLKVT